MVNPTRAVAARIGITAVELAQVATRPGIEPSARPTSTRPGLERVRTDGDLLRPTAKTLTVAGALDP
jgi:hypothetical protein